MDAAKGLRAARREIEVSIPTGGAKMWSVLRKTEADAYGRAAAKHDVYKPFASDDIKEFDPKLRHVPTVQLLPNLPACVAEVYAKKENVIRTLNQGEEEEMFRDLQRRYNHVGGEHREFVKYLHRPDVDDFWHYGEIEDSIANMAILAVGRAKDALLRKICATCPGNYLRIALNILFSQYPDLTDLGLLGAGALCKVHAVNDVLK
jgi:hypothetical protein